MFSEKKQQQQKQNEIERIDCDGTTAIRSTMYNGERMFGQIKTYRICHAKSFEWQPIRLALKWHQALQIIHWKRDSG